MGRRGPYSKTKQKPIKELFIEALKKSGGVITPACNAVGIVRTTYYNWRNEDPEFAAACDETTELALDLAESALLRNIQAGDTKAIKFYLLCKGRSRGYDMRQEIDINATVRRPKVIFEDEETPPEEKTDGVQDQQ